MTLDARTRVLLVDDHALVRLGLRQLIEAEPDLAVVGEADSVAVMLRLVVELDPDVVVLDLHLRDGGGVDGLRQLLAAAPHAAVLVLSMQDPRVYAGRCLQAGAKGYVAKDAAAAQIIPALRCVAEGGTWGDTPANSPVAGLSDRELVVFELIGEGLPTRAIAERLSLSEKTVEAHKANIKRKLGVAAAPELVRLAIMWRESGGRA